MALLQWNQLAAMNRHYVHYSLRDFFSTQQKKRREYKLNKKIEWRKEYVKR